ncbi:MAG: 6-phosphogluconolactonase, partial [Bacteroidetes bacterium]|nr:6-phosphogluconolactonase [Bacteroidota bacterium]
MEIKIFSSADQVAQHAASFIKELIQETLSKKDFFTMALSGGRTPWEMLKYLAKADLPWHRIHLFQVDERMAP